MFINDLFNKKQLNESLRDGEYVTFKVFFDDGTDETLNFSSDDIDWDRVGAKRNKKVVNVKRVGGIQGEPHAAPTKPHQFPDDSMARAQRAYDRQLPEAYNTSENNREYFDDIKEWARAALEFGGNVIEARGVYVLHGWDGEAGEFDPKTGEGWIVDKVMKEAYNTSENNREYFDDIKEWARAALEFGGEVVKARGVYVLHAWEGEAGEFDPATGEGWIVDRVMREDNFDSYYDTRLKGRNDALAGKDNEYKKYPYKLQHFYYIGYQEGLNRREKMTNPETGLPYVQFGDPWDPEVAGPHSPYPFKKPVSKSTATQPSKLDLKIKELKQKLSQLPRNSKVYLKYKDELNALVQQHQQGVAEGRISKGKLQAAAINKSIKDRKDPERYSNREYYDTVDQKMRAAREKTDYDKFVAPVMKEQDVAEAIPYALSAANAAAEYRRQGQAGGGYRGRIDIPVQSKEDYLAVGRALAKAARAAGQKIDYGLSDGVMSIFSDTMTADELDEFIDDVLNQGLAEGSVQDKLHKRHQELRKKSGLPDPDYYKELKSTYDLPDAERYAKAAELKKKYKVTNEDVTQYIEELDRAGYDIVTESATLCPECGGTAYSNQMLAEKQDACYHKVKSRYKVWPSAYASGALVRCRKVGAKNWGNKSKK